MVIDTWEKIHTHTQTHALTHVCTHTYRHMHLPMCVYTHIHTHTTTHTHTHLCTCVHSHTWIQHRHEFIYTHGSTLHTIQIHTITTIHMCAQRHRHKRNAQTQVYSHTHTITYMHVPIMWNDTQNRYQPRIFQCKEPVKQYKNIQKKIGKKKRKKAERMLEDMEPLNMLLSFCFSFLVAIYRGLPLKSSLLSQTDLFGEN